MEKVIKSQLTNKKLPWWLRLLKICLQRRRPGFDPWVRKSPRRRERLPTPAFWPGEFHGQRSLAGYSPWGHKELDTTEWLSLTNKRMTNFDEYFEVDRGTEIVNSGARHPLDGCQGKFSKASRAVLPAIHVQGLEEMCVGPPARTQDTHGAQELIDTEVIILYFLLLPALG